MDNINIQHPNKYTTICNISGHTLKLVDTKIKQTYKSLVISKICYTIYVVFAIIFAIMLLGIVGSIETQTLDSNIFINYIIASILSLLGIMVNIRFAKDTKRDITRFIGQLTA